LNASKKKKLLTVTSILILLLGAVTVLAGAVIIYLNTGNDAEGYALSNTYHIETDSNVFTLWVGAPVSEARLKWIISTDASKEIFAGWGTAQTVNAYTGNYQYAAPAYGWNYHARAYEASLNITNVQTVNPEKPVMPMPSGIFIDTVTTTSSTTLYCTPSSQDRTAMIVIMNSDGSAGVDATIQLGSNVPLLGWLPYVLIIVGIVILVAGLLLVKRVQKQKT
jgi:hypothetical protein